ncbi:MAG: hypothetical protein EAZ08_09500 [Cytophagales bacterium]|nr:MAG: hypothetical protein EAZ08_09500 [Cytophagales bacterium]
MSNACQFYHDTTAHFNAHFLADEKMNEVEDKIFGSYKDNFEEILQVLPPLDTTTTAAYKADFEYCIKKASIPIQYHKQSKWTDDCYIIVGKARMYAGDFVNAMNTFKYVNTESNDPNARHQALILLMRIFIEQNDKKSIVYMANYMAKEPMISDSNAKDFYASMAQFYRKQGNFPKTVEYLEKAIPLVNNRKMKTKFYFVAAQIYQQLGNDDKASAYYDEVLKRNPPYEMTFNAQLNASRTLPMNDPNAVAKGEKYLRNLLSDDKNIEYLDKVYFELGSFEAKRNNTIPAINYLRESLIANKGATGQRISTYLKLGEVYYQQKQDYKKAINYYDSAFALMNEKSPNYAKIKKQIEVFKSFTNSYLAVKESDRLLKLAGMGEKERNDFIDKEIQAEIDEIESERRFYARSQQKIANNQAANNITPALVTNNPNEKKWYFYNPNIKELGMQNFYRTWGNRELEDHWRRSQKESTFGNTTAEAVRNPATDSVRTNNVASNAAGNTTTIAGVRSKNDRLADIPTTSEKAEIVKKQLEKGLFDLAKMYSLLKDLPKAQQTFLRLVNEFPKSSYAAEAIYSLAQLCKETKDCDAEKYNAQLKEKYPTSDYAKLLGDKNFFKQTKVQDSVVNRKYEETYALYHAAQYQQALASLQNMEKEHPDSHLSDKIELLKAMLMVKTSNNLLEVQNMIVAFIEKNKGSELEPLAQSILDNIRKKTTGGN